MSARIEPKRERSLADRLEQGQKERRGRLRKEKEWNAWRHYSEAEADLSEAIAELRTYKAALRGLAERVVAAALKQENKPMSEAFELEESEAMDTKLDLLNAQRWIREQRAMHDDGRCACRGVAEPDVGCALAVHLQIAEAEASAMREENLRFRHDLFNSPPMERYRADLHAERRRAQGAEAEAARLREVLCDDVLNALPQALLIAHRAGRAGIDHAGPTAKVIEQAIAQCVAALQQEDAE